MRHAKIWLTSIALLVLLALALAPSLLLAQTAEEAAAEVGPATIRVGTWESGGTVPLWHQLIDEFHELYPNIRVEFEPTPDGYGTKLLVQMATGDAPDVFQVGDGDVRMFVERGGTTNLAPYLHGETGLPGLDPGLFYDTLYETGVVDGEPHFLTKDYSPLVVYYNRDLFDAAGVPYPEDGWTWDDFREKALQLTLDTNNDGRIDQWGVQLPGRWIRAIEPFIFANGGDLMSEDGTQIEGYLNSPETVEAVQFYVDLYLQDQVSPSLAEMETAFQGVDLFQNGMVAMNWTGRWPLAGYRDNPNLNFGVVGLPQKETRANAICWAGFGLYSQSQNKDAAWLFLRHIGGEPGARVFGGHALPAVPAVVEELGLEADEHVSVVLNELQYLHPLPDMRTRWFNDSVANYFGEALERLLTQGGDVQAELDNAAARAQAELDRLRAQE
ncbi:MAG: sugar ABC transporter substrate-binding protein [Thermosphaera sp.]